MPARKSSSRSPDAATAALPAGDPSAIYSRIWRAGGTWSWSPRSGSSSTACGLPTTARWEYHADRLADAPTTLGEPYSKHLRGPVRELRFHLGASAWRVTYWLASGRRIVLLTVFRTTRGNEVREVDRALAAQRVCELGHQAASHVYDRDKERS